MPRTVEEFEAWHARQPERWEFIGGQPRMRPAEALGHTLVKGNVALALGHVLERRGYIALISGPLIVTDDISAIPDVVVVSLPLDCSTPVIAEPVIIVEIMSPSSETDDNGLKWLAYRKIPSLRHYLVIAQHQRLVQLHSRAGDIWRERFISEGALELDDPPLRLELDALYASTELAG